MCRPPGSSVPFTAALRRPARSSDVTPPGWRIPQQTAASTDPVQWLALTVARETLEDAGYDRDGIPRDRTGVVVGNTLTGEHTRACAMRGRWPFVRRALLAAASSRGLSAAA